MVYSEDETENERQPLLEPLNGQSDSQSDEVKEKVNLNKKSDSFFNYISYTVYI